MTETLLHEKLRVRAERHLVSDLVIADRQREVERSHVETLKRSLQNLGQEHLIEPIVIRGENLVVLDGAHRLTAVKELGWHEIDCVAWHGLDDEGAALIEAESNLARLELSPAQKEEAWRTIYEPMQRKARERAEKQTAQARQQTTLNQLTNPPTQPDEVPHKLSGGVPPKLGGGVPHKLSGTPETPEKSGISGSPSAAPPGALAPVKRDFVKKMTGLGLESINKIAQIRELAHSQNVPEAVREVAQKSLNELKKPGARVESVYKRLTSQTEKLTQPEDTSSQTRLEQQLAVTDQATQRAAALYKHVTGQIHAEMLSDIREAQQAADPLEALRQALAQTLTHICIVEAKAFGRNRDYWFSEVLALLRQTFDERKQKRMYR